MTLLQRFDDLIRLDWRLAREGSCWLVREPGAGHDLLRICGGRSLVFSLDRQGSDPFPYIKENTSLSGMRSVCDALVVTHVNGRDYVFAVEMKTGQSRNAEKQIESAKLFIEGINGLLRTHGHWSGDVTFCGVLSFKPRSQERKGTTARTPLPRPERNAAGIMLFRLKNHRRIDIPDLVTALEDAA